MNLNSNNNSLAKTLAFVPLIFTLTSTQALSSDDTQKTSHRINAKANLGWLSDESRNPERDFVSNTSRVNLIGQIAVSDDLAIAYQFGTYMNLANQPNQSFFGDHNQYVGLKGSFGELLVGRNDTMLKQSLGMADKFNDYVVDIKRLWQGENRIKDAIWYKTNPINNFQFGVTYQPNKNDEQNDAWSYLLGYGDMGLKKTDLYLALGVDRNLKGYDVERITAKFNFEGFNLGAGVQHQTHRASGADDSGILFNFAYPFEVNEVKMGIDFQFQNLDSDRATTLGLNYYYQGKNKIYLWYSNVDKHVQGANNGQDNTILSIGIEHWFDHQF